MLHRSRKNKKPLAFFKRRRYIPRAFSGLLWGTSGLKLTTRLIWTHREIAWMTNLVKWHYKKKYKRDFFKRGNRKRWQRRVFGVSYWSRIRALLPCSKKSTHSRMGKGKGKIEGYRAELAPGYIFLEFRHTQLKKFQRMCRFFRTRFPMRFIGVICNNFQYTRALTTFRGSMQYIRRASAKLWLHHTRITYRKFIPEIKKLN